MAAVARGNRVARVLRPWVETWGRLLVQGEGAVRLHRQERLGALAPTGTALHRGALCPCVQWVVAVV